MGATVKDQIIPNAVNWFTGDANENNGHEDDEEEDGEDGEDDSEVVRCRLTLSNPS
jgi:nucleosome assembly protein 1-like 1